MASPETVDDQRPIIRVRGLVNRFGEQVVHDGLDLDVRRGEILGVVGGSGTGKSVLLRTILGLTPDGGEIEVLGVDARRRPEATAAHPAPHRRAVPGRRAVLLADRRRERQGAAEGTLPTCPPRCATSSRAQDRARRPARRLRAQVALAILGRHAQARRPRARAGARPGAAVPRRADRRARPDRRGRVRRTAPHAQHALGLTVFLSPTTSTPCTRSATASPCSPTASW